MPASVQVGVKSAKAQYGIIVAGGQVGAIGGCTLVITLKRIGVPRLCGVGAALCLLPLLALRCLIRAGPTFAHDCGPPAGGVGRGRVRPGLLEGARLVLAHPYVSGIFVSTGLYKVVATIMDYQMQVLVRAYSRSPDDYAAFMGLFGLATNTVSLLFSLLGTSFVLRSLGLRATLMAYPVALGAVALANYARPDVWAVFYLQVAIKGLSYALQSPSREMLYIVTTDSIKFKAKSWIDVFGGHAAKASPHAAADLRPMSCHAAFPARACSRACPPHPATRHRRSARASTTRASTRSACSCRSGRSSRAASRSRSWGSARGSAAASRRAVRPAR